MFKWLKKIKYYLNYISWFRGKIITSDISDGFMWKLIKGCQRNSIIVKNIVNFLCVLLYFLFFENGYIYNILQNKS